MLKNTWANNRLGTITFYVKGDWTGGVHAYSNKLKFTTVCGSETLTSYQTWLNHTVDREKYDGNHLTTISTLNHRYVASSEHATLNKYISTN